MNTPSAFSTSTNSITLDSGPIAESSRVMGIDVARGIALLGIFFVNAVIFAKPFGEIMSPKPPVEEGLLSQAVFWFTAIFCNGKFYPLFSILFGAGLAMMVQSAQKAGRNYGWVYFRRLVVLALFGIAHIVLLWPGDVLLIYAMTGLWMLLLGHRSIKTLLITGGVVFLVGQLLFAGLIGLMALAGGMEDQKAPRPMPAGATPMEQFEKVLADRDPNEIYDPRIKEIEQTVMTQGPFTAAARIRIHNYLWMTMFILFAFIWVVLPCFCLGAALLKSGFVHGKHREWRKRFILLGLIVGLPLNILAALATLAHGHLGWGLIAGLGLNIGGPMMSLMYLSLILNWMDSGRGAQFAQALGNLGRMALSSYLLESTLMSAVMMHWGLAKFGTTTWAERAGWVLLAYFTIVLFANLWMRFFRFGPLEWLWRSLTYLRWQPILR